MTDRNSLEKLVSRAFQEAVRTSHDPADNHPVDDEEFLIDLSVGDVSAKRRADLVEHLARCRYCRHEISRMIQAGVLQIPAVTEEELLPAAPSTLGRKTQWSPTRLLFAAAATILIAVGTTMLLLPGTSELALARNDLDDGRYLSAFEHAETYLESAPDSDSGRDEARRLLGDAGYLQSLKSLKESDFEFVKELGSRVEELAGRSPRMANIRLQAMRKESGPSAWADRGDLTEYGYRLNGRNYAKPLPVFDDNVKAILAEYERAVAEFPGDPELRLNYGQYLLKQDDPDGANAQFLEAQRLAPNTPETQMALGIIAFEKEQFDAAIGHFRAVLNQQPGNTEAMLNLAICHARLDQNTEAVSWFEKVLDHLAPGPRRDEVTRMIDDLN